MPDRIIIHANLETGTEPSFRDIVAYKFISDAKDSTYKH